MINTDHIDPTPFLIPFKIVRGSDTLPALELQTKNVITCESRSMGIIRRSLSFGICLAFGAQTEPYQPARLQMLRDVWDSIGPSKG